MHGHFDIANLNEDTVVDSEAEVSGGINTGIGVVIPVEKILETIDQPELIELRKKAIADHRKRGAVADFAKDDLPANDANPLPDPSRHKARSSVLLTGGRSRGVPLHREMR
jgi:hypothetical protein